MKRWMLFVVVLVGCTSPSEVETMEAGLVGTWMGSTASETVELWVVSEGETLGGCVGFGFDPVGRPEDRIIVAVTGSSAVHIETLPNQAFTWTFDGTQVDADRLQGTMSGSVWTNVAVTLNRTPETPSCP